MCVQRENGRHNCFKQKITDAIYIASVIWNEGKVYVWTAIMVILFIVILFKYLPKRNTIPKHFEVYNFCNRSNVLFFCEVSATLRWGSSIQISEGFCEVFF